jgi:hypothetical protein
MKRIFVDYTRIGHVDEVKHFRTRLFGSERDGLVPGTVVIIEGDSVPDREATFVEFIDDQTAIFSFSSAHASSMPVQPCVPRGGSAAGRSTSSHAMSAAARRSTSSHAMSASVSRHSCRSRGGTTAPRATTTVRDGRHSVRSGVARASVGGHWSIQR